MKINAPVVSLLLLALAGCATFYNPPPIQYTNKDSLADLVSDSMSLRTAYVAKQENIIKDINYNANATIIGAIAAAGAAIYEAHLDTIAGFGLLAGGNVAFNNRYNPLEQHGVYRIGINALNCMISEGNKMLPLHANVGTRLRGYKSSSQKLLPQVLAMPDKALPIPGNP